MSGYVYCLTNASIPGLVKIGKTARNPIKRAAEISTSTGVPTPFEIAWSRKVRDMDEAEADLHEALADVRLRKKREFFRCAPEQAMKQAKKLRSFATIKPARKNRNSDASMGLALTATTLGVFCAAVMFDLDASTIATATAGFGLTLTVIFQSLPLIRLMRG